MRQSVDLVRYVGANWYSAGLGMALLLALALRVMGLTWGYPHSFHVDEQHTIDLATQLAMRFWSSGSLHPQESTYGALPLYLFALSAGVGELISVSPLYMGRLLSALAGVATVFLTAELARRLFGRAVAFLSALFLATCLLVVREAHFATVDTLLVALIALTLLLGEHLARRASFRGYLLVGVALASAAATKLTAALLIVPLLVAHWTAQRRAAKPAHRPSSHYPLAAAGLVAMVTWVAINPYILLDSISYFSLDAHNTVLTQGLMVYGKPVLYTLHFEGTAPYLYVVTNWLRWGMGVPLEVLALAGVAYGLLRSAGLVSGPSANSPEPTRATSFADTYLLSWALTYFLVVGAWHAKFIRYALPLIPVLCIFASRLLVDLWKSPQPIVRGLSAVLTVATLSSTLAYTVAFLGIYREPDIRQTVAAWLQRNIPPGVSILVENDKGLFFNEAQKRYGLTGFAWKVWDPYEIDGVKGVLFQAPVVSESRTRGYLDGLLTTDYIVISSFWYERFTAAARRFPAQAEFYHRLFTGQAGYRLIQKFQVYPQLGPLIWRDDKAEITFRLFDHPTVYIFKKE